MNGTKTLQTGLQRETVPVLHRNMVRQHHLMSTTMTLMLLEAEFRGPGVRHQFEDSGDDFDMDSQNGRGRIIFLGDGNEDNLPDGEEEEEDKDMHLQAGSNDASGPEDGRTTREETPGPEPQTTAEPQQNHESTEAGAPEKPAPEIEAKAGPTPAADVPVKAIPQTALPDKIVPPPGSQTKAELHE